MNALRISVLTALLATLAAPTPGFAAPADETSSACTPPSRSLAHRRIEEHAARGMPALVGFVHRTAFYQVSVEEAVAWVDGERERRMACMRASADRLPD